MRPPPSAPALPQRPDGRGRGAVALALSLVVAPLLAAGTPREPAPAAPAPRVLFEIEDRGPELPWRLRLANADDRPLVLTADARLLSFDVKVPGTRRTVSCALPDDVSVAPQRGRGPVVLQPGDRVEGDFDPRLYCFGGAGQAVLVPGAVVTPRFGFPARKRFTWKKGKKVQLPDRPPFVVSPAPAPDAAGSAAPPEAAPPGAAPPEAPPEAAPPEAGHPHPPRRHHGRRHRGDRGAPAQHADQGGLASLEGAHFALDSRYARWSSARLPESEAEVAEQPFTLQARAGSDAESELAVTLTASLRNRSGGALRVFFRRDQLRFEVTAPDGALTTCSPEPVEFAPEAASYLRLGPGGAESFTARLRELCPAGTFAQAGLYQIHTRALLVHSGQERGLEAWTGVVSAREPASVRLRTGERPLRLPHLRLRDAGEPIDDHDADPAPAGSGSAAPTAAPAPPSAPAPRRPRTPRPVNHERRRTG